MQIILYNAEMKATSIPMTQSALDAKRAELTRLTALRAEIVQRLQTAREMGDLSENGAYHAAKFELGNVGRQLRDVNHILANAYVPQTIAAGVAGFGKTITLNSGTKSLTFLLVSQYESDPKQQKLSLESPIGQAVIGKQSGDTVTVITPAGEVNYTIEHVS